MRVARGGQAREYRPGDPQAQQFGLNSCKEVEPEGQGQHLWAGPPVLSFLSG